MNRFQSLRLLATLLLLSGLSVISSPLETGIARPTALAQGSRSPSSEWIVDGRLDDSIWNKAQTLSLSPTIPGLPEELRGNVRVTEKDGFVAIAAELPEPGGKVQARSIGYNPVWEKYALTSPAVEDRIRIEFKMNQDGGGPMDVTINPWNAMRVERGGKAVPVSRVLRAARISDRGWTVEVAVPVDEIGANRATLTVERIRSRRPLAAEYHWKSSPVQLNMQPVSSSSYIQLPAFDPPTIENQQPALEVGRVQKVPPINLPWNDPFWEKVPGFELPRNESNPRPAEYPTTVKWVHDGDTLQIFFRNVEDERLDVDVSTRDGDVASDDHDAIYLATSGSKVVEIMMNPVGAIRDAISFGPHAYGSNSSFDAHIEGHFLKERDHWMARLNIPLSEVAQGLGETGIPSRWKVLVSRVRQRKVGEPSEISSLPVIENPFLDAPARFRTLVLSNLSPTQVEMPKMPWTAVEKEVAGSPAAQLRKIEPYSLSQIKRKYNDVTNMLRNQIDDLTKTYAMEEHEEWDRAKTLADWEKYRERRMLVLRKALGSFPENRCDLDYRVNNVYKGDGYQVLDISYQSRPGFYIAANLYLPEKPLPKMPAMIILPAHHYPKSHGEMKDSGMIWARCGVAVLVMENIGFGERVETSPLYRQAYESKYLLSMQLELTGQSLQGWIAYDISRTIDLFEQLGNIDMNKVILLGSVTSGGGRHAAPAGLLESRISAEIIYNFGRVYWYGWGIRNMINNKITPWFLLNAFAPRKLVYAHEFWYEGEEGPVYPSVWVPAWPRYKKVYGMYDADDNLALAQGEGLLRADATEWVPDGDAYMLGTVQRASLYPILKKWFDIPFPSKEDQNMAKDSGLADARRSPEYEVIKYKERLRRPSDEEILSIPPETSARIHRKGLHEIASEMARQSLAEARAQRQQMSAEQSHEQLRSQLSRLLGDIDPVTGLQPKEQWNKTTGNVRAESFILETEPGILVPVFLLKPNTPTTASRLPVVIALAEGSKARFLWNRAPQLVTLLDKGFAVCIPDVRGIGETAPSQYNRSATIALSYIYLGRTLLGSRLKDARSVLSYLRTRSDLDPSRIAVWGDSFAPVNNQPIWVDELEDKPVSPQIEHFASPLGAHLALLMGLYEPDVKVVAAKGGLVSYLSILDSAINYVPPDMVVPKLLTVADLSDITGALGRKPVLLVQVVDGRDFVVSAERARAAFSATGQTQTGSKVAVEQNPRDKMAVVNWLIDQL